MNNWQHLFNNTSNLIEHLNKPYFRYDSMEKSISNIIFDNNANLIWSSDSYGCVSSYDSNFQLYTRYRGHISGTSINDLYSNRDGIFSLSEDCLHFSNRRGVTKFNLTNMDIAEFSGLQSMCYMEQDSTMYCGGNNLAVGLSCIDLTTLKLSNIIKYNGKVKFLNNCNKLLAIGKNNGMCDLLDTRSNQIVKTFMCHSDTITSLDIRDSTLVTTGTSKRFYNSVPDPFVNVFDLRTMKQFSPISFSKGTTMGSDGADFVQLHPVLPTVVLIASTSGSFDFVDLLNTTLRTQFVHPGQNIKDIKLSPNGDHIAVLEIDNTISTWSRSQNIGNYTNTAEILQYPDFVDDGGPMVSIDVDNYDFPLSSIGMPYYNEKLLSAWPYTVFNTEGTIPASIDENLTLANKSLQLRQNKNYPFYRYDKNKFGKRNTEQKYISLHELRQQSYNNNNNNGNGTTNSAGSNIPTNASSISIFDTNSDNISLNGSINNSASFKLSGKEDILTYKLDNNNLDLPPAYKLLPFTYGKYGSNNFDFQAYNKTQFSGLDTDVENYYINAIIQLYRFVPEIFNFVVGCLKDENFNKPSLLSELGYLFDMMKRSNGKVCRAANFQTTLISLPNAQDVILDDLNELPIFQRGEDLQKTIVQKLNGFLLNTLLKEEFESTGHSIVLEQCCGFTISSEVKNKCLHSQKETTIIPNLTVISPTRNMTRQSIKKLNNQNILPYIESSMRKVIYRNNVCENCGKEDTTEFEKTINNLPPLLSFELLLSDVEWKTAKSVKNWLTKEFYATICKNRAIIKPNYNELNTTGEIFKYELNGYVATITDPITRSSRLVTYSRIFDSQANKFKWYLFNNYLVTEIDEDEALNVSYWWKTIEIVLYCDSEELRKPFFSVDTYNINYNILYRDYFANTIREDYKCQYKLLTKEEVPKMGSLVAIDAEFVLLNDEVCDIDKLGSKTIVKPKKPSLARLSVIRGDDGPDYGVPFIDDYIYNKNHIENYLTKYSGILPDDLNLERSGKALVSREVVYRKVWLLMQLGCVFVGHGLNNDFKLININIPPEQIRDTAVYFLQGKRFLSLRYLAFVLLDRNIQEDNHDSIEDAYTALILYKKYLDIKESGNLAKVIETLYEEGRASNYKVPDKITK